MIEDIQPPRRRRILEEKQLSPQVASARLPIKQPEPVRRPLNSIDPLLSSRLKHTPPPYVQTYIHRRDSVVPAVKPRRFKRKLTLYILQNSLIAIVAILAAYSSVAGQVIVAGYAIASLFLRIGSSYSFGAALVLLAGIPFFQLLNQTGVSQNCAIYAYELLVVGTLQVVIEAWRAKSVPS